jgi:hypothetical protein
MNCIHYTCINNLGCASPAFRQVLDPPSNNRPGSPVGCLWEIRALAAGANGSRTLATTSQRLNMFQYVCVVV